jgi:hypothetical protein
VAVIPCARPYVRSGFSSGAENPHGFSSDSNVTEPAVF